MLRTCSSTSCTHALQFGQYHRNFSSVPSLRIRSMTMPTEPASGRCGECGRFPGNSQTSPSRMCTVLGVPSSTTLTCMFPRTW